MNTQAQENFKSFLDNQKSYTYNFDSMTFEQKQQEMITYTSLKLASEKEIEANNIEQNEINEQYKITRLNNIKQEMINNWYVGNWNLEDYQLFINNHPERFWWNQEVAQYYYDNANDKLEWFISLYFN